MWTLSGFADETSHDLTEQCTVLTGLGLTHLEFRSINRTDVCLLDDDELKAAADLLDRQGLAVSAVATQIAKTDPHGDTDEELHLLERALHAAKVLDASYIRVFSYRGGPGAPAPDIRDLIVRRLSRLAQRAAERDVVLLLENDISVYGQGPEVCRDLLEAVGSAHLRLAFDIGNFAVAGARPLDDAYPLLREHIAYVQVKDARLGSPEQASRGEHDIVPFTEGDGQIRELLRALHADGFDGFFSLEPHLVPWETPHPELFAANHATFTRLLAELGIAYR